MSEYLILAENVVLKNNDPMKEQRDLFFNKYLLPPNGKSS